MESEKGPSNNFGNTVITSIRMLKGRKTSSIHLQIIPLQQHEGLNFYRFYGNVLFRSGTKFVDEKYQSGLSHPDSAFEKVGSAK
jgi:hypothetical protein